MHRQIVDGLVVALFVNSFPDGFDTLFVIKPFKDTITSNHEEIEVWLQFENSDFRIAHDNVRVSSVPDTFGLDVAKSSGD
jgi:hypothetical protein